MNYEKFLFIALLFLASACTKESFTNESELTLKPETSEMQAVTSRSDNPYLNGNAVERPIQFTNVSGIIYYRTNPDACGEAVQVVIEGDGQESHVGRFHVVNLFCADQFGNPVSPTTGTITAANGDEIYVLLTGGDEDSDGLRYLTYTIDGGTGRFTGATGEYTLKGTVDEINNVWALEGKGTITY